MKWDFFSSSLPLFIIALKSAVVVEDSYIVSGEGRGKDGYVGIGP